jgi:response regulator of citrate/malate metabolism
MFSILFTDSDFFDKISDNIDMEAKGYTAKEMAKILCISYENVRKRIEKTGIKPITEDAIYPEETLEAIRNVGPVGRPKKAPPEPPLIKPADKRGKAKK